jgi:putative transposase
LWRTFIKIHGGQVAAPDVLSVEVWTTLGLINYYVLFVIDLKSRGSDIAGITPNPDDAFMAQVARNPTADAEGFLHRHKVLICDRDTKFTAQFKRILSDSGVGVVLTPPKAPNCNAFAERFVLSIKTKCLGRMIFFGEKSLKRAPKVWFAQQQTATPPRGWGQADCWACRGGGGGEVECAERLGGLLKSYSRAALALKGC